MTDVPQTFFAPQYAARVYGRRLESGDVLEATDVYSSSNGTWEQCPCPGTALGPGMESSDVIWVRPEKR